MGDFQSAVYLFFFVSAMIWTLKCHTANRIKSHLFTSLVNTVIKRGAFYVFHILMQIPAVGVKTSLRRERAGQGEGVAI